MPSAEAQASSGGNGNGGNKKKKKASGNQPLAALDNDVIDIHFY
jgi:hypothetical protein